MPTESCCSDGFCPRINGSYLRKRFDESLWESPLGDYLGTLPEAEAPRIARVLVDRLLMEVGAE